jgi:hypothetical protein
LGLSDKAGDIRLRSSDQDTRYEHSCHPISLLLVSALVIFSPLQEGGTTHPAQMIIRLLILDVAGNRAGGRAFEQGGSPIPVLTMRYVVLAFVGLALIGDHPFALRSSEPAVVDHDHRGTRRCSICLSRSSTGGSIFAGIDRRDRADGRGRSRLTYHARPWHGMS